VKIGLRTCPTRARIHIAALQKQAGKGDKKFWITVGERMATEGQIAANRANAKRSTGPKTKRGRRASSNNALKHGLSCPPPRDEAISTVVDDLTRTLVDDGASDERHVAARRVAQVQMELSRVRMVRALLMASLDFERCDCSELRRLIVLGRYERIARAKRRIAAKRL
jgi:hypothetical protein